MGYRPKKSKTTYDMSRKLEISDLQVTDVEFDIRQKGVDMKIGLEVASLAYKKLGSL